MLTYQDLLAVGEADAPRAEFVRALIAEHKSSALYQTAQIADEYDRMRNRTALRFQKLITDTYGRKYVDKTATVHRTCNNFYNILSSQLVQFVTSNGVKWDDREEAQARLGADFDNVLAKACKAALDGSVSFVFLNLNHCEVFPVYSKTEPSFAPLYDEESGALAAGVRFWQLETAKPLRATLYELDGYTSYYFTEQSKRAPDRSWTAVADGVYMQPRRPYKLTRSAAADGTEIYTGENYASFPIVPLWGDSRRQSYIVGLREKLDAYDFILNGWEDDLDLPQILWIISGAAGMDDDAQLLQYLDRLRNVGVAAPADGQNVSAVPVHIPVEARETLLSLLEKQIYTDAQAFNPADVKSGSTVVAQIDAAYEPLNQRANAFEYQLNDFLRRLMAVAGFEQDFSFSRDRITNGTEKISTLLQSAGILPKTYIMEKIVDVLGDGDRLEEIAAMFAAEDAERLNFGENE